MSTDTTEDWMVDCSDEETYQKNGSFSKVDGKIDWKPDPVRIAELYQQIETSGVVDLKWINPGRRSPSDHSSSQNIENKSETDESKPSDGPTAFDFDESDVFDEDPSNKLLASSRRKPSITSNTTKKVAKLDKVIGDMKKYQIIDQQKEETKPEAGESKPQTEDLTTQQESSEVPTQKE